MAEKPADYGELKDWPKTEAERAEQIAKVKSDLDKETSVYGRYELQRYLGILETGSVSN